MPDDSVTSILAPVAAAVATPFIGPELLPAALADTAGALTATDALVGAGLGAGASALTGGDPLTGALTGGVGGAIAPNLSDIGSSLGVGGGGGGTAGAAGATTPSPAAAPATTSSVATTPALPTTTGTAIAPSGAAGAGVGGPGAGITGSVAPASVPVTSPDITLAGAGGGTGVTSPASDVTLGGGLGPSPGGFDTAATVLPAQGASAAAPINLDTAGLQSTSVGAPSAPASGGVAGGAGSTTSIDKFLADPSVGSALKAVGANAGTLLSAGGLGYSIAEQAALNKQLPSQQSVIAPLTSEAQATNATATSLANTGSTLSNYLTSGTLPPGVQSQIDQAAKDAQSSVRSYYASRGMSGSSAEAADLARVQQTATEQGVNIATQLLNTGISATQGAGNLTSLSGQLYQNILQNSIQNDQALSQMIGKLATAAAGNPAQIVLQPAA